MTKSQQSPSVLTLGYEKFDPYAQMMFLRRRIWVILGVATIVLVIASAAFSLVPSQYKASSLILIDLSSAPAIDREAAAGGQQVDSGFVDSQVEVLKSQAMLNRVVEKLDLNKDPVFNRQSGGILSFLNFFFRNRRAEAKSGVMSPAVAKFIKSLSVERLGTGYVISVDFTWPDPIKAAEYANALSDAYLDNESETQLALMNRAANRLNEPLAGIAANVRNAEQAVEQFKVQNNLQDEHGVTLNGQQLSEINALLIKARADVAEHEAKYKQMQQLIAKDGSAASIAEVLQSSLINSLKMQLVEVRRRETQLSARYASNHPIAGFDLVGVAAERRDLQVQIDKEVENVITSVKNDLDVAVSRQTSLEESLRRASQSQNISKQASVRLRELERLAESNRAMYQSLLAQMKIAQEKSNVGETKARIVSRATAPIEPSFPQMTILVPLFAVLGLFVGVGSAYIIEKTEGAFYSAEDVDSMLCVRVLSEFPRITPVGNAQNQNLALARLLKEEPRGAYSESVRTLHVSMEMSLGSQSKRVIAVTSSLPSEGKSEIVLSLATSLASAGKSVVVVELDLRKPSIGRRLGISNQPGILEFMAADSHDPENHQTYLQDLNIFLMVANTAIESPPTILASPKLAQAIDALASRFDYVILDTPPLGPIIDTQLIANISGSLILVVEWGQTPREVVSRTLRQLAETKAQILGVVLNAVDFRRQRHYSRYGSGYYQSRYSGYYGQGQGFSVSGKRPEDAVPKDKGEAVVAVPQPIRSVEIKLRKEAAG
jgi:succinoglycan biosynthesis transport protein ExoP